MRLTPGAVPSVSTASSGPLSAAAPGPAAGGDTVMDPTETQLGVNMNCALSCFLTFANYVLTLHNDFIHEKQRDMYRLLCHVLQHVDPEHIFYIFLILC